MTIFVILLFVYSCCAIHKYCRLVNGQRIIVYLLMYLPLFILCAFRDISVGNDTSVYYYGFQNFSNFNNLNEAFATSRYEPAYIIINYLFNKCNLSYYVLQIVLSGFIYFSIFVFLLKYSSDFLFSVYVFYVLRYSIGTMNVVRMWMAIAILLFAIQYVIDRKLIKFLIIILLASLFHSSALVFLIIYPLYSIKINKKIILVMMGGAVFIFLASKLFFSVLTSLIGRYSGYLSTDFNVESNIAVYLTLLIDLFLFALIYFALNLKTEYYCDDNSWGNIFSLICEEDKNNVGLKRILVLSALLAVCFDIIGLGNTVMNRISSYFSVFFVLSIPIAIQKIQFEASKGFVKFAVMIGLSAQFLVIMIFRPNWSGVVPYSFLW